jgi:general secretion pathway protein D
MACPCCNSRITDDGQTINTIQYDDVGILLDVTPHINPDGLVIMDVAPEISALTGTSVPISELVRAPVIATRSAYTRVAIKNGQTIVIGGLMEDRRTETLDKVPLLGDVPLLGEAFRRKQSTKSKTELLIFLTPHVAPAPEALQGMSKQETEGSRLVPKAVEPGAFDEQIDGMRRGMGPATAPDTRRRDIERLGPATDDTQRQRIPFRGRGREDGAADPGQDPRGQDQGGDEE